MNTNHKARIEALFATLGSAFETFNLDKIRSCYTLPCQLSWAGKTSALTDIKTFNDQFDTIWESFRRAKLRKFISANASMHLLSENQALACVQRACSTMKTN